MTWAAFRTRNRMAGLREELDAREVRPDLAGVEAERVYGCVRRGWFRTKGRTARRPLRGRMPPRPSLRAQRSNPGSFSGRSLDCFVARALRNDEFAARSSRHIRPPHRAPNVVLPNSAFCVEGCE